MAQRTIPTNPKRPLYSSASCESDVNTPRRLSYRKRSEVLAERLELTLTYVRCRQRRHLRHPRKGSQDAKSAMGDGEGSRPLPSRDGPPPAPALRCRCTLTCPDAAPTLPRRCQSQPKSVAKHLGGNSLHFTISKLFLPSGPPIYSTVASLNLSVPTRTWGLSLASQK